MALKFARIGRAENLSLAERQKFSLPERGPIIIESRGSELKEEIVPITETGIRGYLLGLGAFEDIEIPEE